MDLKRRRSWGQVHLEFSVSQRVVGLKMMQTRCSTITPVSDFVDLEVFPSLFLVGRTLERNIHYPVLSTHSASLEYYSPSFLCYWTPGLPYRLCFSGTSGSRDHFGLRPKLQVQLRSIGSYPFVIYGGDALLFLRLVLLCLLLLPISSSCF